MKTVAIILAFILLGLAAWPLAEDPALMPAALAPYAHIPAALAPYAQLPAALTPYVEMARANLPKAIAGVALLLFVALLFVRTKAAPARSAAEAVSPAAAALMAKHGDAAVVNFLSLLQEKGRLVDFLMDDITGYSDAQVGAASRVLHEGCKAVLTEHFGIRPMREESEGSKVTVPPGYAADEYRLIGRIRGEAPFAGTLVHHGWKTEWAKLPRLIRSTADRLPAIAPAEVELG